MKKLLLGLGLALLGIPAVCQTNFRPISFEEAMQQAKQENKLVFVDFYTDWCGPCKQMARDVFPQKQVGDYFNATFVCIKLDAEKEGKELAARYQVKAYPTFLAIGTDGQVKMDLKGAMPADAFLTKVKNELNPELSPARMKARYEGGERTPELVNAYAFSFMEQGNEDEGFRIVNDYFRSLTDEQKRAPENFFLFSRYTLQLDDAKGEYLVNHYPEFDPSLRVQAADRVQRLFKSELTPYISGYVFEQKKFDREAYQQLKNRILGLGLDKDTPYQPLFELIECYAEGNPAAYLELLKAKRSALAEQDFELILMNLSRLIPNDPVLNKQVAQYVRSLLPELQPACIMVLGRLLMSLEGAD